MSTPRNQSQDSQKDNGQINDSQPGDFASRNSSHYKYRYMHDGKKQGENIEQPETKLDFHPGQVLTASIGGEFAARWVQLGGQGFPGRI